MRDSALVEDTPQEIHSEGNEEDDGKDAAGAHTTGLVGFGAGAGVQ